MDSFLQLPLLPAARAAIALITVSLPPKTCAWCIVRLVEANEDPARSIDADAIDLCNAVSKFTTMRQLMTWWIKEYRQRTNLPAIPADALTRTLSAAKTALDAPEGFELMARQFTTQHVVFAGTEAPGPMMRPVTPPIRNFQ